MKKHLYTLFVVSACLAGGCSRAVPMVQPSFETVAPKETQVAQSIKTALVNRGWEILSTRPHEIEARYRKNASEGATVLISYYGKKVSIKHLGSTNLHFAESPAGPLIHRAYNRWVENLEKDIQVNSSALAYNAR